MLKRYGFGASFYISGKHGPSRPYLNYMTWEEIRKLHDMGFEIGNHTKNHPNITTLSKEQIHAELEYIENGCREHGIPSPKTFCYPGTHYNSKVLEVLEERGYLFARRGVAPEFPYSDSGNIGAAYDPSEDHPYLLPSTGHPGAGWKFEDFVWTLEQAKNGKIAVFTFHGAPATPHWWVDTKPEDFERYMKYLHDNDYTVIAMRDLAKYVDPARRPADPYESIFKRLGVKPVQLKCEYTVNPVGIDAAKPRFSWILESTRRDQKQAAYQILVASSEEKLKQNIGDLWDSGKVASDKSVNIPYQGRALTSSQKYWWKVRCWNKPGYDGYLCEAPNMDKRTVEELHKEKPSVYSASATFEMGLLEQKDWQGKWIGADKDISAPLLRKEFKVDKKIKRAVAYVSGLGYYEMFINGKKVGDHVLDPAPTYYNNDLDIKIGSRVLYVGYDVTEQLKKDKNAIGVILGNGWYSVEDDIPPSPSHREPYDDRPILLLQLNIEFTDGKIVNIVSDESWKTSAGPITYNDYSNGETYDARSEKTGWSAPGYNDSSWSNAQKATAPSGKLVAQTMPPAKVVKTINPVRILNPKEGVYVYDFGQNFSGWTRLKVNGPKGTKVTIKHGMRVYENGSLDARSNLHNYPDSEEDFRKGKGRKGGWHHVARQTETYILKGQGEEVWEPRFTLHGFRYAEVTGFPGTPTLETLQGRHVRSDVETIGHFTCSNSLLNQIHSNACWTFKSSMQGAPQDAADRSERVSWLGDPIPEDFILNYDTAAFWTKWAEDLSDAQKPNGDLPIVCPLHWRRTWGGYHMWPCWKSTYPIVVWSVYRFYEDKIILEEHYDGMKRLVDFLGGMADEHIINSGKGDHMEPQPDGTVTSSPKHTPSSLTSTAYYYLDTRIVAQAAEILGQRQDARHYAELAGQIKSAFHRKFFDENTNQYATGSQTSNAIPLYLDIVPKEKINAVVSNLVEDITARHHGHLSTGMLGTNALTQVLGKLGRADVMYTIATQTTFPSWGYMISKGATTIWERWADNVERHYSLNMKMFGSVDKFFYKDLAGIRLAAPGYRKIIIKPQVVGDLTYASGSIKTVRGLVSSSWKKTDDSFTLDITIPVNSDSMVSIPKLGLKNVKITESSRSIYEAGRFIRKNPGITDSSESNGYVTFEVGSGSYSFRLTGR